MLKVNNPILTETDLLKIKNMKEDGFKVAEIPTIYYKNSSLEKQLIICSSKLTELSAKGLTS